MELLLYISGSIALLALAVLFIVASISLRGSKGLFNRAGDSIDKLVTEVSGIRGDLQGTIRNLQGIPLKIEGTIEQINGTVARVNGQLAEVEGIVGNVRRVTGNVVNVIEDTTAVVHDAKQVVSSAIHLVNDVQTSAQKPIREATVLLSALGEFMRAFRQKLGVPEDSKRHLNGDARHGRSLHAELDIEE